MVPKDAKVTGLDPALWMTVTIGASGPDDDSLARHM